VKREAVAWANGYIKPGQADHVSHGFTRAIRYTYSVMARAFKTSFGSLSRIPGFGLRHVLALFVLAMPVWAKTSPAADQPAPTTPREFYNAGTRLLRDGKLREAEASFESALAGQDEQFQPPALYNLGHVRFAEGLIELKKGPSTAASQGSTAAQRGADAIQAADQALESNDLDRMVAAYLRGRGARKELRAATDAVQRALAAYGNALVKWQRAGADFKSALEMKPAGDARHNADVVDRCIAKLVDSVRQMAQAKGNLGTQSLQLGEKLKQLKGRIPAPKMPPGAAGDDEEDDKGDGQEEEPVGMSPGTEEGPSKEGKEMSLTQEQAGWLLEGFRLDRERRLPMGQTGSTDPKDRNRPTW
jgi:tetratricopeptide (TPR) repeat protein